MTKKPEEESYGVLQIEPSAGGSPTHRIVYYIYHDSNGRIRLDAHLLDRTETVRHFRTEDPDVAKYFENQRDLAQLTEQHRKLENSLLTKQFKPANGNNGR